MNLSTVSLPTIFTYLRCHELANNPSVDGDVSPLSPPLFLVLLLPLLKVITFSLSFLVFAPSRKWKKMSVRLFRTPIMFISSGQEGGNLPILYTREGSIEVMDIQMLFHSLFICQPLSSALPGKRTRTLWEL